MKIGLFQQEKPVVCMLPSASAVSPVGKRRRRMAPAKMWPRGCWSDSSFGLHHCLRVDGIGRTAEGPRCSFLIRALVFFSPNQKDFKRDQTLAFFFLFLNALN